MYKVRSVRLSSKLLNLIGLAILVFSTFMTGSVGVAYAQDSDSNTYYYYAEGNRIDLTPSLSWVSVKFASDDPATQAAALKNSAVALGTLDQARQFPHPKLTLLSLKGSLTKQAINSLRADTAFLQVNPVFQTVDAEMAVTDEFIATFPAGTSMEEIDAINSSNGVEIVDSILGQENTFVLRIVNSKLDVLSMANIYQESGAALHSAPNFVRIVKTSPPVSRARQQAVGPMVGTNDTLYTDQWYLNNTQQYGPGMTLGADINAPEAWDHTTGSSSIIIAIIDEGTDITHEDYFSKLVAGYDATGLGSGGGPSGNDAHGTNVAGLAAASANNSLGIAGVCQNCKIMPVRIAYSVSGNWVTTDAILANGITWSYQNGADILNNSWGGGLEATVINTAVSNAKTLGRGGKGSVVVFAAGNSDLSTVGYPAYLADVIAVGASNMCDQRKSKTYDLCNGYEDFWGSNYGSALDISAPGVWLDSTDIMGAAGYDPGNYFLEMNGTSGASPIVSGVAGLILSVNPNLTANEVQSILQSTADDVNGGGFDVVMGYGRVNANAAVLAAAVPGGTFTDVPTTYWAWSFIERLYNAGITGGCSASPLMYCPTSSVSRAQMAIFILRGKYGSGHVPPPATGTIFSDVSVSTFGAAWIEEFAAEGITSGCGGGKYCPNDNVTRAQMAIFLLKGKYGSLYVPPVATGMFSDVPIGSFAADWIEQLAHESITSGCGGGLYCPNSNVLRDQMAVFLVKTFNLP